MRRLSVVGALVAVVGTGGCVGAEDVPEDVAADSSRCIAVGPGPHGAVEDGERGDAPLQDTAPLGSAVVVVR